MVRSDIGWSCPQCGSAILDAPGRDKLPEREQPGDESQASQPVPLTATA